MTAMAKPLFEIQDSNNVSGMDESDNVPDFTYFLRFSVSEVVRKMVNITSVYHFSTVLVKMLLAMTKCQPCFISLPDQLVVPEGRFPLPEFMDQVDGR